MIRLTQKKSLYFVAIVLVVAGLTSALIGLWQQDQEKKPKPTNNWDRLLSRTTNSPVLRLGEDLVPPTNRWFSSLVFGESQIAYVYPFSIKLRSNGFELGAPQIESNRDTAFAGHRGMVSLSLSTDSYKITYYDDLLVKITFYKGGTPIVSLTMVQGVPFVYLNAVQPTEVNTDISTITESLHDKDIALTTIDGLQFGIHTKSINSILESGRITISEGGYASIFLLPKGASVEEFYKAAKNQILSTDVAYRLKDEEYITTVSFRVALSGESVIYGTLPHHKKAFTNLGSTDTLYGKLNYQLGDELQYVLPKKEPKLNLDFSRIDSKERDRLKELLIDDVSRVSLEKTDTYFAGKEVYQAAQLLLIAKAINDQEVSEELQSKISSTLRTWFDSPDHWTSNRYFFYDQTHRGVVGVDSSFGSEKFNDHHFHYAYFIYAASILAEFDKSFINNHGEDVALLIADIAHWGDDSTEIPELRVFDRFTGHSWASGYGDFLDGNNQESSSEAVFAWAAIYRWATITKNGELQLRAAWLYSHEIFAAQNYWMRDPRDIDGFSGYSHSFISLIWNGKRDFATFFSSRPQAALGIQLIPMSPAHDYLRDTNIEANMEEVGYRSTGLVGQFGDYLVMYKALEDPDEALEIVNQRVDLSFDEANSKTYTYAWIYSLSVNKAI